MDPVAFRRMRARQGRRRQPMTMNPWSNVTEGGLSVSMARTQISRLEAEMDRRLAELERLVAALEFLARALEVSNRSMEARLQALERQPPDAPAPPSRPT